MKDEVVEKAVKQAVSAGYRLFDSAAGYKNEAAIGKSINSILSDPSNSISRSDLFITSKIGPRTQGFEKAYETILTSLSNFNLSYLDLILIHWPGSQKLPPESTQHSPNRLGTWRALEKAYKEGKVKAIGVSNYMVNHLNELWEHAEIKPAVHQFEFHPLWYQRDVVDWCKEHNVVVQAYSSLGEGQLVNGEVEVKEIKEISMKYGKSKAQVLLKWGLQHDAVVIPKTDKVERMQENIDLFGWELSEDDMLILDSLSKAQPKKFCWDPSDIA
ncbi:NADP-dependent oxidoreductase domain-containing protein [Paraphysoderma sedebokerense]|nr:NADP-dependent oxidoreductase domain-containing protein [Paraphysoderma sedebokerense]